MTLLNITILNPTVLLIVAYGSRIKGDFMEDSVMNPQGPTINPTNYGLTSIAL